MHSSPVPVLEFLVFLFPCLLFLCGFIFGLGCMAIWIWALVEAASKESSEGNDRIVWVLVVALTGIVGAAIYLLVRRPERRRTLGR